MLRRMLVSLHLAWCLLVAAPTLAAHPVAATLPLPAPLAAAMSQPQAFDCASVAEIPQIECEALVALYNSTSGVDWFVNTGWLQAATPCSWYGVSCAAGHVNRLYLGANNLSGSLPSELGNLNALQTLYFGANQLDGGIPRELGELAGLQNLNLYYNQLSGPVPAELGELAALQDLNLGHNQLSGSIPPELGNLTALQMLSLEYNQLSGPIPAQLGNLVALEDLYLNDNLLSGPIPPELGNLTNIRARWTSAHAFGALRPPPMGGYLYLYSNRLSGLVPVELSKLSEAAGIGLGCNQLSGPLPPEVARVLSVIFEGNVDYNLLTGYDPALSPTRYWYKTQTVPPTDLQAVANGATVTLTWTPIPYTGDGGFYEISYAIAADGPYSVHGWTADKTASSYTITGLRFDVAYYFRVRTFTAAHLGDVCNQQSALASDYSAVVSAGGTPTPTATAPATPTATPSVTPTPVRRWLPLVWR